MHFTVFLALSGKRDDVIENPTSDVRDEDAGGGLRHLHCLHASTLYARLRPVDFPNFRPGEKYHNTVFATSALMRMCLSVDCSANVL